LSPVPALAWRHANVKRLLGYVNWWRARRAVHVREVVDRLTADLARQRPDHIAVTGDLVNFGLPEEHEAALAWLHSLGAPEHVSVVPGNHDTYVHLHADPGHGRWQAYMCSNAAGRALADVGHTEPPYVRRLGDIALIGLASGVPTPPFVSSGQLGSGQRRWLVEVLRRARAAYLVRVVMIHHPPHRYRDEWRTGLRDAAALERLLAEEGAELVLHGHFHRRQQQWVKSGSLHVPVIGVPSMSAAREHKGDLAGYSLLRFHRSGADYEIEIEERGLEDRHGPVVEISRRRLRPDVKAMARG
jgi:3',5'-cyclic AMP phosphodiesterase CpdA